MHAKISEKIRIDQAFAPVDIDADQTGAWFSMVHYRRVLGVVTANTVAQTKNVTIQLMQAQDASGTGAKALSGIVTKVAGTGGQKLTLEVEAMSDAMDEGFTHVTVKVTSDTATALLAAALIVRGEGRYGVSMA
jgi:hypothetical protein